mmetsp:Transcript_55994/g.110876  ORF Transcript_55994/g.110876 Transcript_55994/m.110876 type:complete len:218 (-) Transcript_55994:332-985(-)
MGEAAREAVCSVEKRQHKGKSANTAGCLPPTSTPAALARAVAVVAAQRAKGESPPAARRAVLGAVARALAAKAHALGAVGGLVAFLSAEKARVPLWILAVPVKPVLGACLERLSGGDEVAGGVLKPSGRRPWLRLLRPDFAALEHGLVKSLCRGACVFFGQKGDDGEPGRAALGVQRVGWQDHAFHREPVTELLDTFHRGGIWEIFQQNHSAAIELV